MSEVYPPKGLILTGLVLDTPVQRNQSAWTRRARKTGLPGAELWYMTAETPEIPTEAEERQWRAFLFGLGGQLNWFKMPLPCQTHIGPKPRVAAGGTPGLFSQPLKGMDPDTTILYAGQYLTFPLPIGRPRTVCLTADLRTDSLGNATAQFRPALGQVPATDAEVETAQPFIPVCSADTQNALNLAEGVSGFQLNLIEDMGP